jgi:L-ascorbate metabolism protein UlaG (beta-lactamase superfamily)
MLPPEIAARASVLVNGQSYVDTRGFSITAIPMYNLPTAENKDRHVKGRGNGYLIEKNGTRVYIAGDTAGTPELRAMTDIGIAFVPMNMPYTMSVEEAADAVLAFKPRQVYPYHYRSPDGLADVEKFKQLVNAGDPNIQVVFGPWYPAE